ncbi:MAG: hypothetical protein WCK21_04520 [Actinomycetota bacterium]
MTEVPSSRENELSQPSVVIDANATVKQSRLPFYVAAVAVVALAAFTVIYFTTRDSADDYKPGPVALAVADSMKTSGLDLRLSGAEMKCIDQAGKGIDPQTIKDTSFDKLDTGADPDFAAFAGALFDTCFDQARRVDLFAAGMTADGSATDRQATCAATALDGAVIKAGGYKKLFAAGESEMMTLAFGILGAMSECGIDLGGLGQS